MMYSVASGNSSDHSATASKPTRLHSYEFVVPLRVNVGCGQAGDTHPAGTQNEGNWQLTQPEPGVLTWRVPSGRTYTTKPTVYAGAGSADDRNIKSI
jgi:hypothetical protein